MVKICWLIPRCSHYGRRALIGIRCAAGHPQQGNHEIGALRQPGSSNSGSWGSGAPEKVNYRPRQMTGQQPNSSRRPARKPIPPGRSAPRLAGASQAVDNPGPKERAPCGSLAADRFEASHCPSPVAGGRQPRPRSHDHGHAVHSFISLPAPHAHARAAQGTGWLRQDRSMPGAGH